MSDSTGREASAYPFQSLFVPFPFVCFSMALGTDIAYWQTANLLWLNFSAWLLFAGLVFGGLALLAGFIDLFRVRTRPMRPSLFSIVLFIGMLLLALLNSLVHAGDGWTAVVPYGLLISTMTFVVALTTVAASSRKYARLAWRV
ncbi:DUF2231 domain-containing protein [Rhizobium skierniewicense]|uniref:DUF2231 domain-containing protein n=1 Tax=Rhizobium skierniewicense TaxID=984260 RepID=UPI001571EF0A|nr:DUF2231 domain-containing protein [Rhizobium skierniewicense]NTF31220.1 DUF2231 domain-containing protein [Rhizobium skierniewicense]